MKRRLSIVLFFIILFPTFYGLMVTAPIPGDVDKFNDDESFKVINIETPIQSKYIGSIDIPKRAIVTNATFNVTTQLSQSNDYPKEIFIDVGEDNKYEWAFFGDGYGNFGQQKIFLNNKSDQRLKFEGNNSNTDAVIRLPKNATVSSSMMLIDGKANVSGADPSKNWNKLRSIQGTKVAANISSGSIYFTRFVSWMPSNYFDIYDPITTNWKKSRNCPDHFAEPGHAITEAGDRIFICTRNRTTWVSSLFSYNTKNNTWKNHGTLPTGAWNLDIGGLTYDHGDNIYGIDYFWSTSSAIAFYKYSISKNKWTKMASPLSTRTIYPTLAYNDGRVYLYNYTSSAGGRDLQYYEPSNDTWFRLKSSPVGIITRVVTDSYNLFGADSSGRIIKYDIPSNTWAITGRITSNFISNVGGFGYSDRSFYLDRYWAPTGSANGFYTIPGLGGGEYPYNSSLDIGDNGLFEWNITGEFNTTDYVNDFSSELNSILASNNVTFIDAYGNEFVDIVINVTSERDSEFAIRKYLVNYTYTETVENNPETGNLVNSLNDLIPDTGEGNISIPIFISSSTMGRVNISNISIDYYIPDLTNDRLEVITGHEKYGRILYTDYTNYTFLINVTYLPGYTNINTVTLYLDIDGENLQLLWTEVSDTFTELRDPKNLIQLDTLNSYSINNGVDHWTLNFMVRFDWMYPNETLELCALNTTTDLGPWRFNYFEDVYQIENDLDLIGSLQLVAEDQGLLTEDGRNNWVHANEKITWGSLYTVYEGTTDIYPDNKNFNITIQDDDGDFWYNNTSSGSAFNITTLSDPSSDYSDLHLIDISDIPGLGLDVSNWSFEIKTDNDNPGVTSNILCHADTPSDPQTDADDDTTIFVTWGVASDGTGSGVVKYASEFNNPSPIQIKDNGESATGVEGLSTFYVRARDKVGNWGEIGSASIFIDLTSPAYSNPSPSPNVWQRNRTVICGIIIDDIGGSGVDIESVQYRYVDEGNISEASWNNYNGPGITGESLDCQQNITFAYDGVDKKIQWRVRDLAGNGWVYSDTYELKIDSQPPMINYIEPNLRKWQNVLNPDIKFFLNDTRSSGIDINNLKYSISTTGLNGFGDWIKFTGSGSGESVLCSIKPMFEEGSKNYFKITATDNSGNTFIFKSKRVKIDVSGIDFLDPKPKSTDWSSKGTVNCKIKIHDEIGIIDTSSIKYQTTTNGTKHYSHWKSISIFTPSDDGHTVEVSIQTKFKDGSNNYIRWRATDLAGHTVISNHFKILVDKVPVRFGEKILMPSDEQWSNVLNVPCSISVNDTLGSGVQANSIEYSISTTGLEGFGKWTKEGLELIDLTIEIPNGNDGQRSSSRADSEFDFVSGLIQAKVTPNFLTGSNNYIRWRGTDFAGNDITYSMPQPINIDQELVNFKNEKPEKEKIMVDLEVMCMITIEDFGGSGVDLNTVEYRYSSLGLSGLSDWLRENINHKDETTFFVYLTFEEGVDNYIQWRAKDLAGNNYATSDMFNISVNSPPIARIKEPKNLQKFTNIDRILFDASISADPDVSDSLIYIWESNISKIFGDKMRFSRSLPPGWHNIKLTIYDQAGHSSQANIDLIITKFIPPEKNDTTNGTDDESSKKSDELIYDIAYTIILIIIVIIILVSLNFIKRNMAAKAKLEEESKELPSKLQVSSKASIEIQSAKFKEGNLIKEPDKPQIQSQQIPQPPVLTQPQMPMGTGAPHTTQVGLPPQMAPAPVPPQFQGQPPIMPMPMPGSPMQPFKPSTVQPPMTSNYQPPQKKKK